jgi:acetolactate synthase-1/2/3 large subunit
MQQEIHGNRMLGIDLLNPDFIKLGESFGVTSYRAASPDALRNAIEKALAKNEPALIEAPIGDTPAPWAFIEMPRVRGKKA